MGHWTTFCSQLQHPELDQEDKEFRSCFQAVYSRLPQQEDVPTWHYILLTENITVNHPLTWQAYQAAAHQHMLRPLAQDTPAATQTTDAQGSIFSSPEACTPLSSPPRPMAPPTAPTDAEQPHRTFVTTSPCLTDKRRSCLSDD